MDCLLGPSELAGSGQSLLEKGGECKVHKRRVDFWTKDI